MTLLFDANLYGHAELLEMRLGIEAWRELRDHLDIHLLQLEQSGLDRDEKDDVVWRLCQERGYYLVTANRNRKSEDSLQATIQREGTAQSIPVFTSADANRIFQSAVYLDEVVETLLEYLLDEANYRGTGRLFLPRVEDFTLEDRARSRKMPPSKLDREAFISRLREKFPKIEAQIDDCRRGLLHCEMAVLARATQDAIDVNDCQTLRGHFAFVDALLLESGPDLENAIYVSYLENLQFEGREMSPTKAREILTPRLRSALADLERYLFELFDTQSGNK